MRALLVLAIGAAYVSGRRQGRDEGLVTGVTRAAAIYASGIVKGATS
jgi:hypothetical protein